MASPPAGAVSKGWLRPVGSSGENIRGDGGPVRTHLAGLGDGTRIPEVGYLLEWTAWHKGYAVEAARACRDHAFSALKFEEVFSIIRDSNLASQRVARCIGMEERGSFIKHYYGMDMLHIVFSVRQGEQLPPAGSP